MALLLTAAATPQIETPPSRTGNWARVEISASMSLASAPALCFCVVGRRPDTTPATATSLSRSAQSLWDVIYMRQHAYRIRVREVEGTGLQKRRVIRSTPVQSGRVLQLSCSAIANSADTPSGYQRHPGELCATGVEGHCSFAAGRGGGTLDETVGKVSTARAERAQRL